MTEDFDKICRTCLEEITDFKYLFNLQYHVNEGKWRLSEILTACTSIEVLENDNLPKQVCIKCENNILNAFSFQQLCRKSDSLLKSILTRLNPVVQPQLIQLKPLVRTEEVPLNFSKQFNNILSYNTSEKNENHLVNKVGNFKSQLNKDVKDHSASGKVSNEEIGSDDVNFNEQKHTSSKFNESSQSSYHPKEEETTHIQSLDSQDIELNPSSISIKQEPVNNLDDAVNAELTSVKILKEENDNDERNFGDQGHIDPPHTNEMEDETLQHLFHCEAKGCFVSFTILEDLKEHVKNHLPNSNYCKICNKTFHSSNSLSLHIANRHHPENKRHSCTECGRRFTRSDHLKSHIAKHTGEKPFKCSKCDTRFYWRRSLVLHMKIHTGQKDFICEFCKKCFIRYAELIIHKRGHTGEKPFSCNICGKSFPQSSRLMVHLRSHSREKPYVCTHCGVGCVTSSLLKRHMRIHTGEKPHQCNLCSECFNRGYELKRHTLQVHTDKRDYVCDVCHKGFLQKSKLKQHMVVHTGEKPFTCNVCNKTFGHKGNYRAHMKRHERNEKHEIDEEITLL